MRAEQDSFDQACRAQNFALAAAIARSLDHRADHLGIILNKPGELFWRSHQDHPGARLILDRLTQDGNESAEDGDYSGGNALSKDEFSSLFKVMANAMGSISSGNTRMRLASVVVKRVDLRCELISEMPRWFKDSITSFNLQQENVFDVFAKQFGFPLSAQSLRNPYQRPKHETDKTINDFVKTCHEHGLISDNGMACAATSEDETVAKSIIEIVGIGPVLAWRSSDGANILHQSIWDQRSQAVMERLLAMGVNPREPNGKFDLDNVLEAAVFIKSRCVPMWLQAVDWSVSEISSSLQHLHGPHNQNTQQIQSMLQAAMALASMRQIRSGMSP